MPFVSNAQQEPADRTPGIRMKPDQFEAKLRHVGVIGGAPSQPGNRLGRSSLHGASFATHAVIAITDYDRRSQERPLNHATDNARA